MDQTPEHACYTVDLNPLPEQSENHKVIVKNALNLKIEDIDGKPIDLVFFDCHDMIQMDIYRKFVDEKIITDDTILALHDTNLHYKPLDPGLGIYNKKLDAMIHQPVEREMVNMFKEQYGYDVFSLHTTRDKHDAKFPYRHGITICQKFKKLEFTA